MFLILKAAATGAAKERNFKTMHEKQWQRQPGNVNPETRCNQRTSNNEKSADKLVRQFVADGKFEDVLNEEDRDELTWRIICALDDVEARYGQRSKGRVRSSES